MSEQFTMPRKLAHELLGALFNGPGLNPAGYEALKQDFAARMRAAPAHQASSHLLPCPFCGSPAGHYPDGDVEGYDVMCTSTTSDCKFNVFGSRTVADAEALWNRRAAPAPAGRTLADLLAPQPLTEPVDIAKALLAHREARAVLSAGSRASVHLVNISLTGWAHTEDTAMAFADGYNLALKQLRAALLGAATTTTKGGTAS